MGVCKIFDSKGLIPGFCPLRPGARLRRPGFPVGTGTQTARKPGAYTGELRREILHSAPFDYAPFDYAQGKQGEQDDKREAGPFEAPFVPQGQQGKQDDKREAGRRMRA